MTADSSPDGRFDRALASLRGLAVGDALGSQFFVPANYPLLQAPRAAARPLAVDRRHRDGLLGAWPSSPPTAASTRTRWPGPSPSTTTSTAATAPPSTGCCGWSGRAATGASWPPRSSTARARGATAPRCGSPRWAPGTPDDPEQATHQAEISAYTTHQHREAVVGAMAVAAAAALAADPAGPPSPRTLLDGGDRARAAQRGAAPGCGGPGTCSTTATPAPSRRCWAAAGAPARMTPCRSPCGRRRAHLGDYEQAFWTTAQVGGDVDTTCAIVGGMVGARAGGAPPRDLDRADRSRCRIGSVPA